MESNRLTIIPIDSAVYRDQAVFVGLDLTGCNIPSNVHALQWMNGSGWIEFTGTEHNQDITELPNWALNCVNVWQTAYELSLIVPEPIVEEPTEE